MSMVEEKDYFYARQYAYDLLRRIFIEEPTVEFMHFLQKDKNLKHFPFANQNEHLQSAITQLKNYLKKSAFKAGEDDFENLHWDYTRLFIGPEAPPAPPWESVYVSKDKLLFQESTNAVKRFYESSGFKLENNEHEAADHIGFELDFMYHLSSQSIENLEKSKTLKTLLEQQNKFLKNHLLAFSNAFTCNMIQYADIDFYRACAVILQEFLTHDQQWADSVLKKKVPPRWQ